MADLLKLFEQEFFTNAVLIGLLISIACGIMGSLIVTNKLTSMTGSIAHSSYAGIGIAFFFGFNPTFGAVISGIFFAIIIGFVSLKLKSRTDTIISIIWAVGMALGLILVDLTPGYNVDLMSWLFGSIIAVSKMDLLITFILDIVIIIAVFATYKELLAMSYDSEFAKISGVPVKILYFILLILTAVTVVVLIRIIGLIMVIAMLTIPALISERFSRSLIKMIIISIILSIFFIIFGIVISFYVNLKSSALIIMIAAMFLFFSFLKRKK